MRWGEDAVDVVYECIAHNIPISNITAAQSGATAPAPIAGFLAQSLAETLASLVMVNVIKPAHPMIFSNWPLVIDLRTGAFSGGGAEAALMNAASARYQTGWVCLWCRLFDERCQGVGRAIWSGKGDDFAGGGAGGG